jgi:hypothetical protein
MSTWFDMGIESINTQSSLFHQIWKLWLCTVNGDGGESCSTSQMNDGKTTIIEIMCTRELGDPFRRRGRQYIVILGSPKGLSGNQLKMGQ